MTFSITATPAQYAGANGESPAHVIVDIPTTETITKVTRTDSRGVTELFPDAARAIPNNYPGIGGAVVNRTNHVLNPSLEVNSTDWALYSWTGTGTRESAGGGFSGAWFYRLTPTIKESAAAGRYHDVPLTAKAGDVVTLAIHVRPSQDMVLMARGELYSLAGGVSHSPEGAYGEPTECKAGVWTQIVHTLTAQEDISKARHQTYLHDASLDAGGTLDLDAETVVVARGENAQYFDGSTAAGKYKYRWKGAAHASPSEEYFSGWRVTDDGCPFETVTYTAHTAGGTQSVTVNNSRPEMPVLLTTLTGGAEWVIAEQITEYTANRETGHVHHDVGDAFPLVTYGPRKLRTGTVGIYCSSHAEALKVESVLTDHIALIRQHVPGLDLTVSVTRATLTPYEGQGQRTRWAVSVEYVEVVYTPVKRII